MGQMDGQIDLDRTFRPDSKARQVAERLLTGRAYARQDLADEVGVPRSAVNKVVDQLQDLGAVIRRDIASRQATFQLVGAADPQRRVLPQLDEVGRLVADELMGQDHVVRFSVGRQRFHGVTDRPVPVGADVRVVGMLSDGPTVLLALPNGRQLRLGAVRKVE